MSRLPAYPLLFALYLPLDLLSRNLTDLNLAQSLRAVGLFILLAALLLVGWQVYLKDWQRAAFLAFLGLVFFFGFTHVVRAIQSALPQANSRAFSLAALAIWSILLLLLGSGWLWKRLRKPENLTAFLNIVLLISLFPTGGRLFSAVRKAGEISQPQSISPLPTAPDLQLTASSLPDIYFIVVDGYARDDVLRELYQFDNQDFLGFLEEQGFYIARESPANYIRTYLSIGAALNFDYLENWTPPATRFWYWSYGMQPIFENRLVPLLKDLGYQFVVFDNLFWVRRAGADTFLSPYPIQLSLFEQLLLAGSPPELLLPELPFPLYNYATHRQRTRYALEELARAPELAGPKFIYAHLITPHPPFVFDRDGKPIQPAYPYSINDGSHYEKSPAEYIAAYREQTLYINKELKRALAAILSHSARPPIIILQADHGPGALLDWNSVEGSCLWERTSILNAIYLPQADAEGFYPGLSPVNTFRLMLNSAFQAGLPLLEDRTFFLAQTDLRQMIEITDIRDSRQNCTLP